jgi:Flp pilus assembly CpaE family ATPase
MSELSGIFLVTTPEVEALLQSRRIIDRLVNLGHPKEFIRVAVNRVFADQDLSASELGKMIGLPVEAILPDDRREVAEAHSSGRLISPRVDLGKRIAHLAASIAGQNPVEKRASRFSLFRSAARTQPA